MLSCLSDILKSGSQDYPSEMEKVSGLARDRARVGGDRAGSLAEALWSEQVPPTELVWRLLRKWITNSSYKGVSLIPAVWVTMLAGQLGAPGAALRMVGHCPAMGEKWR